jgi:hypothetical protein
VEQSVWNRPDDPSEDIDIWETLGSLAHDLDLYEPDPVARTEDHSYYHDQSLEDEVLTGLRKLREQGVRIPPCGQDVAFSDYKGKRRVERGLPVEIVVAVRNLIRSIVEGDYEVLEADGRVGRLSADDLRRAIANYGRTLIIPPDEVLEEELLREAVPVGGQ